jgi:hypothetical protein
MDDNVLKEIQSLEKGLGKTILAFSCHDVKTADVTDKELESIQALEEKLGLSLVAVNA